MSETRQKYRSFKNKNLQGFTLFEIILASAIFVLLAGGVYFAVSTSVRAADELGREQMEARKRTAFISFLRRGFLNLPPEAEISLQARNFGQMGSGVDLVIRRALGSFETGVLESKGGGAILVAEPDGKGASQFSVVRFSEKQSSDSDLERHLAEAKGLPILTDVSTIRWRFWDKITTQYVETWERPNERPELIELTYQLTGEAEIVAVFRLPIVVAHVPQAPKEETHEEEKPKS